MQQTLKDEDDILSYLTTLSQSEKSGEILFHDKSGSAKVYLNRGMILWAFATGQRDSFQSILLRENHVPKDTLVKGIKESRKLGKKNLEDILQTMGVEDPRMRREIIERHTRSAFDVIGRWAGCAVQFKVQPALPEDTPSFPLNEMLGQEKKQEIETMPSEAPAEQPSNGEAPSDKSPEQRVPTLITERPPEPSVTTSDSPQDIPDILKQFQIEIPNFLATMIIDGKTGMPIASRSDTSDFDPEITGAFYRDLIRAAIEPLKAAGKECANCELIEELLITQIDSYVLLKSLKGGAHTLYLLMDKNSNPGMARVVMRRYIEKLDSLL